MTDFGIQSHLANLNNIASPQVREAYLSLVVLASACGLDVRARSDGAFREVQFRDAEERQPFSMRVLPDALLFSIRRPMLDLVPSLAQDIMRRFGSRVEQGPAAGLESNAGELRIRLQTATDVEAVVEHLLPPRRLVSLGPPSGAA